jgi:hypothetical protein
MHTHIEIFFCLAILFFFCDKIQIVFSVSYFPFIAICKYSNALSKFPSIDVLGEAAGVKYFGECRF